MSTISHSKRYLPHELKTKFYACQLYRQEHDVDFVCRRYHISKASLMRWNKIFDGTKESLVCKSHRPHTPHPNAHSEEELTWIRNLLRRNPHISICELYGKLRTQHGYTRHPASLYRVCRRLGFLKKAERTKKPYQPQPYDTPRIIGVKWQMDVKFVPMTCNVCREPQKYYQYTMIDEASRERFIYPYPEQSSYSTCDFVRRALVYFGYKPQIIQTDNGAEFCHFRKTRRIHPFDVLCQKLGIQHQKIRPRTPRHNGKVERSHRTDQERFYNFLSFYSYEDLKVQMNRYLYRSNRTPMRVLEWRTPLQMRKHIIDTYHLKVTHIHVTI